ncbi:hypothetical protein VCHA38O209_50270 [Vibrio chagasii]|nr:hypothetical protein VCHA38O209_50270 [Vibrio chagasii]
MHSITSVLCGLKKSSKAVSLLLVGTRIPNDSHIGNSVGDVFYEAIIWRMQSTTKLQSQDACVTESVWVRCLDMKFSYIM